MKMGRLVGCWVIALIFGFIGMSFGDGFINSGSVLMLLVSIPWLILISAINIKISHIIRGRKE